MRTRLLSALALLLSTAAAPVLAAGSGVDANAVLKSANEAIEAENYTAAIAGLQTLLDSDGSNADALNLMGYANRKAGDLTAAARWYQAALAADPNHLGALEYQGEMFLMLGDVAAAQANLARLVEICGACEEQEDLAKALADAGA